MADADPKLKTWFEWTGRNFETSHAYPWAAELLDGVGPRGKRRVAIMGDYQTELRRTNKQYNETTTWLYSEDGTTRIGTYSVSY